MLLQDAFASQPRDDGDSVSSQRGPQKPGAAGGSSSKAVHGRASDANSAAEPESLDEQEWKEAEVPRAAAGRWQSGSRDGSGQDRILPSTAEQPGVSPQGRLHQTVAAFFLL